MYEEPYVEQEEYYEEPVYEEPVEYYEEEEKQPYIQPEIYDPGQFPLDDEIEPTITDINDEDDMDEGTVMGTRNLRKDYNPVPSRQLYEEITPSRRVPPRKVVSPRMQVVDPRLEEEAE